MTKRRQAALLMLGLFLALAPVSVSWAQGWTSATGSDGRPSAGYGEGSDLSAIMLTCAGISPGQVAVVFGGIDAGLSDDTDYPAAVSVDGVAFLMRGRLRPNERRGDKDWVRLAPLSVLQPMIDALQAGSEAEISTPAGRYRIDLRGSGRALDALGDGCG